MYWPTFHFYCAGNRIDVYQTESQTVQFILSGKFTKSRRPVARASKLADFAGEGEGATG